MLALPLEVCAAFFDAEASADTVAFLFLIALGVVEGLGVPAFLVDFLAVP